MFKSSLACLALLATGALTTSPGYSFNITPTVTNSSFSFGQHYAVLNLDLVNDLVATVNTTKVGEVWINNVATWINTVHKQDPPPLSIFSRIYYSNVQRPEIGASPFGAAVAALGNLTASSPGTQLYPAFKPLDNWDVVVQKARYYAGAGNPLEEILSSQRIDTVILSGIRTSGVVLSTAMRLLDLNYNVYVIANNTIESPSTYAPSNQKIILEGILPNLPVNIITIEQAIGALNRSGPAVY
ncbi:cysteine hydrolase family protein [Aspergillus sclerotiicarbonarius CBS 121057]|uniref:Cysteine hydrolase family protein n=1 Tax=Aspergillus sclerotiicarbonarius (strain CBS 121057 / IBT 28362) TaxID=1448318 RepID=A0A319EDS4_ASPSB|nr:cysteine hydrolase family protein [Aspergillus sclerotiicarbonarius CBS 121057]